MRPDRFNPSFAVYKNGAVFEGRRRDGMDPASSKAQQLRLSAIGYRLHPIADSW